MPTQVVAGSNSVITVQSYLGELEKLDKKETISEFDNMMLFDRNGGAQTQDDYHDTETDLDYPSWALNS